MASVVLRLSNYNLLSGMKRASSRVNIFNLLEVLALQMSSEMLLVSPWGWAKTLPQGCAAWFLHCPSFCL